MTMGETIKELRKTAGYTQEELGSILNPKVNRAAINKWESGQVENIKRTYIEQMAALFRVHPSELMCFELPLSSHAAPSLSPDEKYIITTYRSLNQLDQKEVVHFVDFKASDSKYTEEGESVKN